MRSPSSSRRYLGVLLATAFVFAAGLAKLNYFADPYGIYHYDGERDWIHSRPEIRNLERLHKAHAVAKTAADTLILGNSRVVVGIDPFSPVIPQPAYNLGVSGATNYECLRYLQHATALHPPQLVLLGLDTDMFCFPPTRGDFSEARMSVAAHLQPQRWWRWADATDTLFSLKAVADSLHTIFPLRHAPTVVYRGGLRDAKLMTPLLVPQTFFTESERAMKFVRDLPPQGSKERETQFTAFAEILAFCAERNIRLVIFTNPLHHRLLDVEMSDNEKFDAWFQEVAALVEQASAAHPGLITLWDFYGYNAISGDPYPVKGEPFVPMPHYWEVSHYRKEVGDLVLAKIFGQSNPALEALPSFGHVVTAQNLAADRERIARERADFAENAAGGDGGGLSK